MTIKDISIYDISTKEELDNYLSVKGFTSEEIKLVTSKIKQCDAAGLREAVTMADGLEEIIKIMKRRKT